MKTAGQLLVATPPLEDPNFDRTVVYIIEHRGDGALGVVINRPSTELAPAELSHWTSLIAPPAVLFAGGPVETNVIIGLADLDGTRRIGSVDLAESPGATASVRLFRGYSGWAPGQLDDELLHGAWVAVPCHPDDIFCATPQTLWRDVLRRQGGQLAWLATAPDDLSLN